MTPERIEETAVLLHQEDSDRPWDEAPEWVRTVARSLAKFALENPGATGEQVHHEWARCMEAERWVYDTVENERLRTHPMLKAYRELTREQQAIFKLTQSTNMEQQNG